MATFDQWLGASPLDLSSVFGAAATANSDPEYSTVRTADTVTTDALGGMTPITSGAGSAWSDWLKGVGDTVLKYSLAKDVATTNAGLQQQQAAAAAVSNQAAIQAAQAQQRAALTISPGMLMLGAVGLVAFMLARRG